MAATGHMIGAAKRAEEMLRPRLGDEPRATTGRALAVRWEISPAALRGASGAACRAVLESNEGIPESAWLEWEIDDGAASATLTANFADGRRRTASLVRAAAAREWETNQGKLGLEIRHVEVAGALLLTVRTDGSSAELLYAWTGLLGDALGLRGGVYDAPSARLL